MKTRSVCVVTHAFLQDDGHLSIGGVETYVHALCNVLSKEGIRTDVLQASNAPFQHSLNELVTVTGVGSGHKNDVKAVYQSQYQGRYDLTLFTTLDWAVWSKGEPFIAFQHGISWDEFNPRYQGFVGKVRQHCHNRRRSQKISSVLDHALRVVCVDLNFANWLRAVHQAERWEEKLVYIPNFGTPIGEQELAMKLQRDTQLTNVLIARRFETYRGIPLIAEIIRDIAADHPDCYFRFAGTGPQEQNLRRLLANVPNSSVNAVPHEEMDALCLDTDVAIVPTLWSEGTSLACIEAMCAGCAVLATGVGGLSNLLLPDYNGLIAAPTYESLKSGLLRLLKSQDLRRFLGRNAHATAQACFCQEKWDTQIRDVILTCMK